jgi:uncharacterized membrane protein YtjA (UPF0391 family)
VPTKQSFACENSAPAASFSRRYGKDHAGKRKFGEPGLGLGHCPIEMGGVIPMLRWALIFLVIGLIAGVLGFTGVAGASIAIAKTLFFIFMLIFLVLLIAGLTVARKVSGG